MNRIYKILLFAFVGLSIALMTQPVIAEEKININTAPIEELVTMKHVGEKLAEKIIEYRKTNPFEKPEDIMNVKGVGQKVFDANKDIIVVKDEG